MEKARYHGMADQQKKQGLLLRFCTSQQLCLDIFKYFMEFLVKCCLRTKAHTNEFEKKFQI